MGASFYSRGGTNWSQAVIAAEGRGEKKQRALHVLTLTPFYPHDLDEGAGCFVSEPIGALSKLRVVNTVLALQPFYRKRLRIADPNTTAEWVRYISFPGTFGLPTAGLLAFARIISRIRQLHRRHPIDLIHAHAPLPAGHLAMLLNSELGLPYVISVHGLDVFSSGQFTGRAARWCGRISRLVYQRSNRVICISEAVRQKVLEGMPTAIRTSVVYNGVDTHLFFPAGGAEAQALTVLDVGNLIPSKGHDVLIRAIAAITSDFPGLALEIIGEGVERSHLRQLTEELGLRDQVKFLGRRSRREVAEAMRRCMVFALPSSYEGLGCVYLEAMSTAKPVVGCREQGIAEIIRQGNNGYLVGAGNVKELSLVLSLLLRDEHQRQSVGLAARDTILDRLTLAQQAEHLARIYRECTQ